MKKLSTNNSSSCQNAVSGSEYAQSGPGAAAHKVTVNPAKTPQQVLPDRQRSCTTHTFQKPTTYSVCKRFPYVNHAANVNRKGRFGKRALSVTNDHSAHYSEHSNSNSNDSGIDFNSYESHLSWHSEDAHIGRPLTVSSSVSSITVPHFSSLYNKELCENLAKEKVKADHLIPPNNRQGGLFDINSARLLMPEKAILEPQNMRLTTENSTPPNMKFGTGKVFVGTTPTVPNSISPVPMKRPRFNFSGSQISPSSGKGTGLKIRNQNQPGGKGSVGKRLPPGTTPTLTSSLSYVSRDQRARLEIVSQPEEQHRARYQTEGSRGAIKDRKGNGFPTVKLVGYDKPATLQIFIGTDQGRVSPHMFYQACKVTGKSSTPCIEKKVEGTIVIEIEFEPSKDMTISCDCVGILKERNVDVEQRFPFHHASQSRKKSTKCRMVFRTTIINSQGLEETLQLSSNPILCTQPPGHPEICKQSTFECSAKGGIELFVIGKNFLKDTKVLFQQEDAEEHIVWETSVEPLKDYLQQNHLICPVPPFKETTVANAVECKIVIVSGGKRSEPQRFTYLPISSIAPLGIATSGASASPTLAENTNETLAQPLSHPQTTMSLDIHTMSSMSQHEPITDTSSMSSPGATTSEGSSPGIPNSMECTQPFPTQSLTTTINNSSAAPGSSVPLTFANVINPVTTAAQERQVVNELQSILDQSVQQRHQEATVPDILPTTNVMPIKSEPTSSFARIQVPNQLTPSVPLDLQFPTENVAPVQPPATLIPSTFVAPGLNSSTFVTSANNMHVLPPAVESMTSPTLEAPSEPHNVMKELLPSAQATLSSSNIVVASSQPNALSLSVPTSSSILSQPPRCGPPEEIKMETPSSTNAVVPLSNSVPVASETGQVVTRAGAVTSMQSTNSFVADLQPHQGTLASALTQLSDNELINYINPSCFEQNIPLV